MLKPFCQATALILLCALLVYAPEIYTAVSGPFALSTPERVLLRVVLCTQDDETLSSFYSALTEYQRSHPAVHLRIVRTDSAHLYTLDAPLLQSREEEIRALFARCSRLQAQAARYYGAAGGFLLENQRTAACLTDYPKVRAFAQRTADRCLPKGEGRGKEQLRLLSALTPKGVLTWQESIPALARQVWVLEDEYGTASRVILETLRRLALERGHDLITCRCAAFEGKIDHLILPGLGLAFVTSNSWHPMAGQKNIHCSRFLSREGMRAQARRMRFVKKAAADMLAQGAALQAQALDTHNELEVFYRQAVDFALVEARGQALARQLGL